MKTAVKRKLLSIYMKVLLSKEKTYQAEKCNLKYLFFKNVKSKNLLVVFSGFPPDNKARYNYIRKFSNVDCNKLYILDDFSNDGRGSYYLAENNDFFIENAVSELINEIATNNGISKRNIITAGSSKGGFASLYFAIKYGLGYAIAGAPQVLLGDYLNIPNHKSILNYIFGENNENSVEQANAILLDLVKNTDVFPELYIHVGKDDDEHLEGHVPPLIKALESKDIEYDLDIQEGENHSNIGLYYPAYATKIINKISQQ